MFNPPELPDRPGVYLFRDRGGDVIYVGKARSLRSRVRSYFRGAHDQKTEKMRSLVEHVDYIVTDTDIEALVLELNLIKRYRPRYNIKFADDKHYPYIRISPGPFARVHIVRKVSDDGARYFGPYTVSGAVGSTLKMARKLFPFRTCSERRLNQRSRPCLYFHIKRCPGACSDNVSEQEYADNIRELTLFLEGRQGRALADMKREMNQAADNLQYERAAVIRDRIRALETIHARQKAVLDRRVDQDVFAVQRSQSDSTMACAQILQIRDGKLVGEQHFFLTGADGQTDTDLMDACVKQYYQNATSVPPEVLVSVIPDETELIEQWLSSRLEKKVVVRQPQRGPGRALMEMASANARIRLQESRPVAEMEDDKAEKALSEIAQVLELDQVPERIEGYDTSASAGDEPTGSMVVFTDGKPDRSGYRRFSLQGDGLDDLKRLTETVKRRLKRLQQDDDKFNCVPDMVLVDGGSVQRTVVEQQFISAGLQVPVVGLAKEEEEIYVYGKERPIRLSRSSIGLQLLQRIRDEAHRFSVNYHRHRRSRRSISSVMDDIPGVGSKRKKALIKKFGSVSKLKQATSDEIASVQGIGNRLARDIKDHLKDL